MSEIIKWISITDRFSKMYLNKNFEEFGINSSQHMFIKKIYENEGITQDELYSCIFVNKSNIARAIAQLEQKGFITKIPNDYDKRSMRLYTTDKSKEIYEKIKDIEQEWINIIEQDLNEEEKNKIEDIMKIIGKSALDYLGKNREEFDEYK